MKFRVVLTFIFCAVVLVNCAKRGRPTGGPKDEAAPIMVSAKPPFESTNFNSKEIRIYFDEFVKLKDLNKQLVVSPPMKISPIITPIGTPSKYIKIKILDTLKENTTYTFNFGQSVIDNTEGNILRNFKYVFSTGSYIDSLKVSGTIKDAFNDVADKDVSILLYEYNDQYTDSLIYKEKPLYVGNTLDTTNWQIGNIKSGTYKLFALKDVSKDYIFNPKQDKIAFLKDVIVIPEDSVDHKMVLFKEVLPFKVNRPSEETKNRLLIGYQGIADSIRINDLTQQSGFESIILPEKNKDSLNFWYKNAELDSLYLEIINKTYRDTVAIVRRTNKTDSLQITSNIRGVLPLRDKFKLLSNTPLVNVDTTKFILTDADTLSVDYTIKFRQNSNEVEINFKKKQGDSYKLEIMPEAFIDFLGTTNDTLRYNFKTKKASDYGNLFLTLQNVESYPILVQLIQSDGELIEEVYAESAQEFVFSNLEPAKYKVRVIYDANKNGKWDTGNFLLKIQPEKVVYYPTELSVRANWEMSETFILN